MRWSVFASVCAATAAVALLFAGNALAGYGVQPANGTQTTLTPTFLVYLDGGDSGAQVHVGTDSTVDGNGFSSGEIGSCIPSAPYTEQDMYTCQPSLYSTTGTNELAAGTYYWWLTFYRTDPGNPSPTLNISGPFQFTAAAPTPPAGVTLVSPADGVAVSATPRLVATLPANATVHFYVSTSPGYADDGTPEGTAVYGCSGTTTDPDTYYCDVQAAANLAAGSTYYWWVAVSQNGGTWVYGPRSFTVKQPAAGGGGTGGGGTPQPRAVGDAPYLPSSPHYTGHSVKQTRLSAAAYALSKLIGAPKSVAVACWSTPDWANIVHQDPESAYTVLGFWMPGMPHWLELSPSICRTMETLLYHRPKYPNRFTANAVDTLTHEMLHALGLRNEAMTECVAMQLSWITAHSLGVPLQYSMALSRLTLENYRFHPPSYVNTTACREDGAWDVWKGRPSLPWHQMGL